DRIRTGRKTYEHRAGDGDLAGGRPRLAGGDGLRAEVHIAAWAGDVRARPVALVVEGRQRRHRVVADAEIGGQAGQRDVAVAEHVAAGGQAAGAAERSRADGRARAAAGQALRQREAIAGGQVPVVVEIAAS